MAKKHLPKPKDPLQPVKPVGSATGQIPDEPPPSSDDIRRVMSALGKIGGPRGGRARADALSGKRKTEIAKKAARARWSKRTKRKKRSA